METRFGLSMPKKQRFFTIIVGIEFISRFKEGKTANNTISDIWLVTSIAEIGGFEVVRNDFASYYY